MTTPTITEQAIEALRWILAVPDCKITSPQREKASEALARFDAAQQAGEQALPQLPMHPEPHTMTWTALEARVIEDYGKACARAAQSPQPAPEAQQAETPQGATHYQPHQKAYYKRVSATEWFLWSDHHGWMPSKGTSDNSQWVTLEKLDTPLQQPAQAVPLTDEQISKITYAGYDNYWDEHCPGKSAEAWAAAGRAVIAEFCRINGIGVKLAGGGEGV